MRKLGQQARRMRTRLIWETIASCVFGVLLTWFGRTALFGVDRLPIGVTVAAMVAWWLAFVLNLQLFVLAVDTWLVMLCYFGLRAPIWKALCLMEPSKAAVKVFGLICVALVGAMVALYRVPFFVPFGLVLMARFLSGLTNAIQPPTMLVLANSNEKALWLQERLSSEILPHRVVSLLRLPVNNDEWSLRGTPADIVRTKSDDDWRTVVEGLLDLVPIVMFDVRVETDFVREEALEVRRLGLEYKTLFVTGGAMPAPLIESYLGKDIAWVHDWSSSGFLWYVTSYRRVRPSRILPLHQLYREFSDHVTLAGGNGAEELVYLESILDRIHRF